MARADEATDGVPTTAINADVRVLNAFVYVSVYDARSSLTQLVVIICKTTLVNLDATLASLFVQPSDIY